MHRIYFPISEETARTAQMLNSFRDYVPGSATAEYQRQCNTVYDAAEETAARLPYLADRAESKAQHYAKKLADYYNAYYRNEAACPSVMICGPANFPTRKKERQNSRRDSLFKEWEQLEAYADSIRAMGTGGISADDPQAIPRLRDKLREMEETRERWKHINAYYRKHKSMQGFPDPLTEQEKDHIALMGSSNFTRFGLFDTANISARIRSAKERLERLEKEKNKETTITETSLFQIVENTELMRLQLIFPEKPDEETRSLLKSNGFRWSPKNQAWQRQLTNAARYAAENILQKLAGNS